MRVADYVINRLVECGIEHIFMITGRGILYLTDAVAKCEEIEAISTYHEQGASYAAMAYAKARNGMAACLISTGCAATNAVTAALCAYQDNLPVIFISGQNMLEETTAYTGVPIRTYGSQEANIIPIVSSITKYAKMLTNPENVWLVMDEAIQAANSGRKGPVWIDIPLDIQNARIAETLLDRRCNFKEADFRIEQDGCRDVAKLLNASQRPVLFVGGGTNEIRTARLIKTFAEKCQMPVVFSTSASDVYGTANECSIGAVGSLGGTRAGNFAVQNADLILAIGTKLCSQTVGNFDEFGREAKIVVVDIDEKEHTKNGVKIDKFIKCDAAAFMDSLMSMEVKQCSDEWLVKCKHWKEMFALENEPFIKDLREKDEIDLYSFASVLSKALPDDATVITDAGFEELIIPSSIQYKQGQKCLFPASQGAMGYAIPAIIGAYYAGRKEIVTVVGDGSIMMNLQELQVIKSKKIPVKLFVINNGMYAVIRKRQQDLFRKRTIGNDASDGLDNPDFKKIADCFGLEYRTMNSYHELKNEMQDILKKGDAVLVEVKCTPEQKYFHTSYGYTEKRKLVKRPLEDLSPFVDRKVFKSEMVITPLEE